MTDPQQTHLPTFSPRPTIGYSIGNTLGHGCLTAGLLCNLCRLYAVAGTLIGVSQVVLAGSGWLVLLSGIICGVLGMVLRPKRSPVGMLPDAPWTAAEKQVLTGAALDPAQLGIDYGTDATDRRAVIIAPELRRAHQLVMGGSGTGKSKFIAIQAAQSVVTGASLFVVDPHEELATDILCSAGGQLGQRRGILLWPDGPSQAIFPWQPLQGQEPWQVADTVVAAVKRVWQLTDANTYILDVLKHTAWGLAGAGWTLLEGGRFLTDIAFRNYIAAQCGIPQVQLWVQDFNAMNPRDQRGLVQTTLVRLNRLNANPHIQRLLGCGVTDARYRAACAAADVPVTHGASLMDAINQGYHVFCVVPKRTLGEDQYLVAGLAQAALQTAVLSRMPNDPAAPHTEAYLDEAAAYANAEGLGQVLAQARKFKLSATVAMQGYEQAEPELVGELKRNTAIKVLFATDNVDEAEFAAKVAFGYDPTEIKIDTRQWVKQQDMRREVGRLDTYSPTEQNAYYTAQMTRLPNRHYMLKVRGTSEARTVVTPPYHAQCDLRTAMIALRDRAIPIVHPAIIDQELAFRQEWLHRRAYEAIMGTEPPTRLARQGGEEPNSAIPPSATPTQLTTVVADELLTSLAGQGGNPTTADTSDLSHFSDSSTQSTTVATDDLISL